MINQLRFRKQALSTTYYVSIALIFGGIFATIRVIGTLGPPTYRFVLPLGFVIMALMPFIFLDSAHRHRMGLTSSKSRWDYGLALFVGIAVAYFCFLLGKVLFATSADNWYVTIRNSYANIIPADTESAFLIVTIPAIVFSPIGEEMYFRGFLQDALSTRFSYRESVVGESLFFGVVHLCHHGLRLDGKDLVFQPVSGSIWVLLMFLTACLFAWLKRKSQSIYPAIVAHASFNFTMNVCIFYVLD